MLSVYNFDDPVSFISHYLDSCKELDKNFSLKKWAQLAGLKSTVQLIDILKKKKKISNSILEKIIKQMNLDNSERLYFYTLVAKFNSESQERKYIFDYLLNELSPPIKEFKTYRTEDEDLFSHYIYMAILSMSELKDFKPSVDYINQRLVKKVDPGQITQALSTLFKHELLVFDENGCVRKSHKVVTTKTDYKMEKVETYYSMTCDLAKEAAQIPPLEREFQCFSLPASKNKLEVAKQIIRKCRSDLDGLTKDENKDMVYQVNLMMFPLASTGTKEQNAYS